MINYFIYHKNYVFLLIIKKSTNHTIVNKKNQYFKYLNTK